MVCLGKKVVFLRVLVHMSAFGLTVGVGRGINIWVKVSREHGNALHNFSDQS